MSVADKLKQFAVYPHYIRPSSALKLIQCPASRVMLMDFIDDDTGGQAAQTGSIVHEAAAAFHKADQSGKDLRTMLEKGDIALSTAMLKFPFGDQAEATKIFDCYKVDSRNHCRVTHVEHTVDMYLPPHRLDPTQQPIYIKGTLDQIRDDGYIYDIKTGQSDGWKMTSEYAVQQCCYFLMAKYHKLDVQGMKVIRTRAYRTRGAVLPEPDGVFWEIPLNLKRATDILDRLRVEVAMIRSGEVNFGPGTQCAFCEHGGLSECGIKLDSFLGLQ